MIYSSTSTKCAPVEQEQVHIDGQGCELCPCAPQSAAPHIRAADLCFGKQFGNPEVCCTWGVCREGRWSCGVMRGGWAGCAGQTSSGYLCACIPSDGLVPAATGLSFAPRGSDWGWLQVLVLCQVFKQRPTRGVEELGGGWQLLQAQSCQHWGLSIDPHQGVSLPQDWHLCYTFGQ